MFPTEMSPLAQGRGLKLNRKLAKKYYRTVAPRTGAWIETSLSKKYCSYLASPLAQGRGLKLPHIGFDTFFFISRPSHRGVD